MGGLRQGRAQLVEAVTIRPAVPREGPALMKAVAHIDAETEFLGVPGQVHPWAHNPEAELRSLAQNGRGIVFLALTGDAEIVGYLSAFGGQFVRNRGSVFIAVVGLREGWRGRGIGTRLFEAVEAWARQRRAWRLELRVSSLNDRGQALYRKQGFAMEGRIRGGVFRHGAWTDDFWMGKLLEPLPVPSWLAPPAIAPRARRSTPANPALREVRAGDGAAFRGWEMRMCATTPLAVKQPEEVAAAEAIERDIAIVSGDPRLWVVAVVPEPRRGSRIVGFASGSIEFGFRMQHDAFISVSVLPEWCGRGIGRTLHERVEEWARGRGARRLTAAVQAPNPDAREFAAALGYDLEVTMRSYALIDGRMVDRLRLGKLL